MGKRCRDCCCTMPGRGTLHFADQLLRNPLPGEEDQSGTREITGSWPPKIPLTKSCRSKPFRSAFPLAKNLLLRTGAFAAWAFVAGALAALSSGAGRTGTFGRPAPTNKDMVNESVRDVRN